MRLVNRFAEWAFRAPRLAAALAVVFVVLVLAVNGRQHRPPVSPPAAAPLHTSASAAPAVTVPAAPAPAAPSAPPLTPPAVTPAAALRAARGFTAAYLNAALTPRQRAAQAAPYTTAAYDVALTVNPPLPLPSGAARYRVVDVTPGGGHVAVTRGAGTLLLTLTATEGVRVDGVTAVSGD